RPMRTTWDDRCPPRSSRGPNRCATASPRSSTLRSSIERHVMMSALAPGGPPKGMIIITNMLALRYVYVLALVVWLGGMLILGALVAPTTFEILQANGGSQGRELAGVLF